MLAPALHPLKLARPDFSGRDRHRAGGSNYRTADVVEKNAEVKRPRNFSRNEPPALGVSILGAPFDGRRLAVADLQQEICESGKARPQQIKFVPELVGCIESLKGTFLASAVPFRCKGADVLVEEMPGETFEKRTFVVALDEVAGLLEELKDAGERRSFGTCAVAQRLQGDA
jgi:hypothetical protein